MAELARQEVEIEYVKIEAEKKWKGKNVKCTEMLWKRQSRSRCNNKKRKSQTC